MFNLPSLPSVSVDDTHPAGGLDKTVMGPLGPGSYEVTTPVRSRARAGRIPSTDLAEDTHGRSGNGLDATDPLSLIILTVREVRPGAQLRDRDVRGAGAGVELAVPIPVAHVGAIVAALAVAGAADRVGLSRHQRVDERG